MADEQFTIDLGDDQRGTVVAEDALWLSNKLRQEPGATRLRFRYDSDEVEGHAMGHGLRMRVIAEDDTEGHAISIHFPSASEADAFRKRLMLTGVLAGTVALGAAGGMAVANLTSDAGTSGAVQSSVTGSDWSQVERPPAALEMTPGSAWTPDERPGTTASGTSGAADDDAAPLGGPTPR